MRIYRIVDSNHKWGKFIPETKIIWYMLSSVDSYSSCKSWEIFELSEEEEEGRRIRSDRRRFRQRLPRQYCVGGRLQTLFFLVFNLHPRMLRDHYGGHIQVVLGQDKGIGAKMDNRECLRLQVILVVQPWYLATPWAPFISCWSSACPLQLVKCFWKILKRALWPYSFWSSEAPCKSKILT
jgi:hypothetical protein